MTDPTARQRVLAEVEATDLVDLASALIRIPSLWKAGIPCLLYGPGAERGGPDGDDSCVLVSEMVTVTKVLALTALDVCDRTPGALAPTYPY